MGEIGDWSQEPGVTRIVSENLHLLLIVAIAITLLAPGS
jgi:hypothetical protein